MSNTIPSYGPQTEMVIIPSVYVPRDEAWGAIWDPIAAGYRLASKDELPTALLIHPTTVDAMVEMISIPKQ